MKIGSVTQLFGDSPKRERKENSGRKKDESEPDADAYAREADAALNLGSALSEFGSDPLIQATGLSAELDGQGPGLKVTLKDGRGAIVRQFTGQEFVELREAAAMGANRGKLLDKKF
jgi:hypothetical protein